jgi:hypothetical protein
MSDMTGHDASQRDNLHTMTLSELEEQVAAAGVLISRRQLMRHCEAQTFDAKRLPAVNNLEQWFIAPGSVEKGIADIKTLQEQRARRDASRRDMTGHDGLDKAEHNSQDTTGHEGTRPDMSDHVPPKIPNNVDPDVTRRDGPRPGMSDPRKEEQGSATEPAMSRYVALLESDNEFLREQVKKKDDQITDLSDRFGQTQSLLGAMQRMLAPLLGQGDPFNKPPESREFTDQKTN